MMAYAASTGNRRNLAALKAAGWGMFLSPSAGLRHHGLPYALDNGAWRAFVKGIPFDEAAFAKALALVGAGADFVVVPDIVQGGLESLTRSRAALPGVLAVAPVAMIAVQDGMTEADVAPLLGPRVGVFVGGSTEFKETTMGTWAALAHAHGAKAHVGRVNTARRVALCAAAGVDSFDGSSASRYAVSLPLLENARRQTDLFKQG